MAKEYFQHNIGGKNRCQQKGFFIDQMLQFHCHILQTCSYIQALLVTVSNKRSLGLRADTNDPLAMDMWISPVHNLCTIFNYKKKK